MDIKLQDGQVIQTTSIEVGKFIEAKRLEIEKEQRHQNSLQAEMARSNARMAAVLAELSKLITK